MFITKEKTYFSFTSAIRAGIKFAGTEIITLGGQEALWLFVNKVRLLDYVSTGADPQECFVVDLSPAATSGGGTIIPEQGTISGGSCTGLTPLSEGIFMNELEVRCHLNLT